MVEIDLSTIMLIGIDEFCTKVITFDNEFVVDINSKKLSIILVSFLVVV